MKPKYRNSVAISVVLSVVATWLSGFLLATGPGFAWEYPKPLVGVSHWGFPFSWKKQIVVPHPPTEIIWAGLFIDLVFWFAIFLAISSATAYRMR